MIYISDVINKPVRDAEGTRIGQVQDLLVPGQPGAPHPRVTALVVKRPAQEPLTVAMADVAALTGPAVRLARSAKDLSTDKPKFASTDLADALWLGRDILDKEIIDTESPPRRIGHGARLVRVNDLELAQVNGHFRVANVSIGGMAILRRLGLARLALRLAALIGHTPVMSSISWDNVELLPGTQPRRIKLTRGTAPNLPPADLADIISDLSHAESSRVVESLDVERLADTLEEVEPDVQASLVESLSDEKVADVLEEMAPDEAADLLAELPEDRSESLLQMMESGGAEDVRSLLTYPEDTAGGLMTTDVVTIRPNLTVEQAIATLRETAQEAETLYYIYVTDAESRLLGVFSLQSLVLAKPETPISEIMHDRVIGVKPSDSQTDVAQVVAKYNLLAVPVVDDQNCLMGIVTADDAIDKIIPADWKKRLPRLYH